MFILSYFLYSCAVDVYDDRTLLRSNNPTITLSITRCASLSLYISYSKATVASHNMIGKRYFPYDTTP